MTGEEVADVIAPMFPRRGARSTRGGDLLRLGSGGGQMSCVTFLSVLDSKVVPMGGSLLVPGKALLP